MTDEDSANRATVSAHYHRPLSADVAKAATELSKREAAEKGKLVPPPPRAKLLWVGIDLDGTLATPVWTPDNPTSEIGEPIWSNVAKLWEVVHAGYKVVIHTSRPWTDYEAVERWLHHHDIPFKQIQMGKPLFALYVDDRGRHADAESWLP